MSFHVAPLESRECGRHCPDVIVADGVIEAETPQAFVDFLKSGSSDSKLRRIVFFNSRGGNVVASMVFGHILRGLRIAGSSDGSRRMAIRDHMLGNACRPVSMR